MKKTATLLFTLLLAFAVSISAAVMLLVKPWKANAEMVTTTDNAYWVKANWNGVVGTLGSGGESGSLTFNAEQDEEKGLQGYRLQGSAYYYGFNSSITYAHNIDYTKGESFIIDTVQDQYTGNTSNGDVYKGLNIYMGGTDVWYGTSTAISPKVDLSILPQWTNSYSGSKILRYELRAYNASAQISSVGNATLCAALASATYYIKVEITSDTSAHTTTWRLIALDKTTFEEVGDPLQLTIAIGTTGGSRYNYGNNVKLTVSQFSNRKDMAIDNSSLQDKDKTIAVDLGIYNFDNGFTKDNDFVVKANYSGTAGTLGQGGTAGNVTVNAVADDTLGLYGYKAAGTAYYYGWETKFTYDYAINTAKPVSFLLEPNYESSGDNSGQYNASTLCRKVHIEMAGTSGAVAWNLFAPWAGGAPEKIRFSGTGTNLADTSTNTNYVNAFYAANNSAYYLKVEIIPNGTSSKLVLSAVSKTTLVEDSTKFEHTFTMPSFSGDVSLFVSYSTGYSATALSSVPDREKTTNLNFGIYNFRNGDVKTLTAENLSGDAGDSFTLSDYVSYDLFDGQSAPTLTYAVADTSVASESAGTLTIGSGNTDTSTTVTVSAGNVSKTFTVTRTHTWDAGVVKTDANCSANGITTYTCSGCGAEKDLADIAIDPDAHDYEFSSFEWNGYEAQAIYVCSHNAAHTEAHAATVTSRITTRPTPSAQGVRTYTATYDQHESTKGQAVNLTFNAYNISIGTDITLKIYAGVYGTDTPTVEFDISDSEVDFVKTGVLDGDEYVFTCSVAPQNVGKNITLTLTGADNETCVKTTSVAEYIYNLYNAGGVSDELAELLARLLVYADAATEYQGGTGTLATEYADIVAEISEAADYVPENSLALTSSTEAGVTYFSSANVVFASTNRIIAKFVTDDVSGLTVEIDGVEVAYAANGNGVYSVKSSDIYADGFDTAHTFTLKRNGVTVQTLTYDLATYVYAVINGQYAASYKTLAQALYNYGAAAAAYRASI